ncbi:MAG: hypothetical protein A3J28_05110 [Acidobacteria bacterium RIFCSPLOWO2_12_FULL_60_22]|nr:MAG: hypothetical protein A3J28_05110 [Acidobacteria bacterium RIFCSPLOWO2_12_FULL_60_22]
MASDLKITLNLSLPQPFLFEMLPKPFQARFDLIWRGPLTLCQAQEQSDRRYVMPVPIILVLWPPPVTVSILSEPNPQEGVGISRSD